MSRSINTVLFDLDDTLYDERTFVASGFRAVAAHLGERFALDPDPMVAAMDATLAREGRGSIFDRLLETYGLNTPALVGELVAVYRGHRPTIALFPDAIPALEALRDAGFRLGIITDGAYEVQRNKVAALALTPLVDVVVCTDELGRAFWKPHTAPFERALKALGVRPEEAVYIGNDSTKDFTGPNRLGMQSIHLCRDAVACAHPCDAEVHIDDLSQFVRDLITCTRRG